MPSPLATRRAFRSTDDRWLGGVASGLAEHMGLPVLWVRMGMLALVAFGGFGAVLYAGLWLFLPGEAAHRAALPGPGRGHPAGQARRAQGTKADRLRTPGGRRRDRHRGAPGRHDGYRPDAGPRAAPARRCRSRAAVVAGRRGAAATLARPVATDGPGQGHRRWRGMAGLPAHPWGPPAPCSGDRRRSPCAWATCPWRSTSDSLLRSASSASASWWVRGCSGSPRTSARSARHGCAPRNAPMCRPLARLGAAGARPDPALGRGRGDVSRLARAQERELRQWLFDEQARVPRRSRRRAAGGRRGGGPVRRPGRAGRVGDSR